MAKRPQKLVIVIPALNEALTIGPLISRIPLPGGFHSKSVVVVDDGSTDETARLAREAGAIVVSHGCNRGVGAAFASGLEKALELGADVIVNMDGDGQFAPEDIQELIKPVTQNGFGFATCTRFGLPDRMPAMPAVKRLGNRGMCWIINWCTGLVFSDVSCGFRAYSRETALRMNLFGSFTYTQESIIDLASKGISMTEVPLIVRGEREFGKSRVASNLWRYAAQASKIILRALRDTRPLFFFGCLSIGFLLISGSCFGFVGLHWALTGRTSPWTSLLFLGTASSILGVGVGILAMVADQIGRGRVIQERLLYYARRRHFESCLPKEDITTDPSQVSSTGDVEAAASPLVSNTS